MTLIPIAGDRIRLREWRADEVDGMHRWIGNPEVMRFLSWGSANRDDTIRHLEFIVKEQSAKPRTRYFLAIELNDSSRTIGDAGFTWVSSGSAEIGYFLEPEYWGRGLGVEAARMIIDLAFNLGANEVQANCFAENTHSERIMIACGMSSIATEDPLIRRYRL
ncbi:MAG: GNAT family N-acetyltransferase [Roseibium sp.]|nr:GNAT family N-acetyltransferase [Roseibium sp.]